MALRKTSAEYFSHDADASEDEKIMYLETVFGFMGYALYFKMLERLCRSDNFEMKFGPIQRQVLSKHFGVTPEQFDEFIVAATSRDIAAFRIDADIIWSDGLKKRMGWLIEKRQRDAERIAQKRAENAEKNHNSLKKEDVAATRAQVKESKVKESKVKYSIDIAPPENANKNPDSEQKKIPPSNSGPVSHYNPPVIDLEVDAMLTDDLCKERFFRQCQIPIDQFTTYAENFRLKLKSEDHKHSNRKDFRSHFFSWARLENERAEKAKKNGTFKFRSTETINDALEFAEQWRNEERLGIPH